MPADDRYARFEAFGCGAVVAVEQSVRLAAAQAEVERIVGEFDLACSRFRDDSGLSAVNAAAGTAVPVGPLLLDAVGEALRAARLTDGAVDPTVGQSLIALGYNRDLAAVEADNGRSISIVAAPGWRTVKLDRAAGTIRVPRGVKLDLGATAKALAADHAARDASAAAGCGVLVSLGGDIALGGPSPGEGWRVRVTDDHRADLDAPGQWITLRSGGLATSSTTTRRWRTEVGAVHHLVDPLTGGPAASAWRTVSVAARSCVDANIASTASIIRGAQAVDWLSSLGLPSRLVGVDGAIRHLAGWPEEGDDLG
jgi:FAD:protein FMN transferase